MRLPCQKWPPGQLDRLTERYGERRLKVCDVINRRSSHIVGSMIVWGVFIPWAPLTQAARVTAVITYTFMKVVSKLSVLWSDSLVASILFRAARFRDGNLGRFNVLIKTFVAAGFLPLVTLLMLHSHVEEIHTAALMGYVFQACIWGDAFAEIIGSFFGRYEFSVKGAGEINRKTIEGVMACFLVSTSVCFLYSTVPNFPGPSFFIVPMYALHMLVALVATLMETVSYRGTDNGTMVLSSALVVLYCYKPDPTHLAPAPLASMVQLVRTVLQAYFLSA